MHRTTRRAESVRLYPWVTVMVPVGATCFHSTELMKSCAGVGRGALALVRVPGQPSENRFPQLHELRMARKVRVPSEVRGAVENGISGKNRFVD